MKWDKEKVSFDHVPISIKMLPGEEKRERVVAIEEERKYFLACKPLLRDVATILLDAALRPEECFRMRREDNQDGVIRVQYGKTEAAHRRIPMTPRVRAIVGGGCQSIKVNGCSLLPLRADILNRRVARHRRSWPLRSPK